MVEDAFRAAPSRLAVRGMPDDRERARTTASRGGAEERAGGGRARARDADPGPAPAQSVLHEAALSYLARGSATAATLTRVLDRKVTAWARRAERAQRDPDLLAADLVICREAIAAIVTRFREVGLIDDAAYAASRARSLSRAGRSRRAISAHLAAKGVDAETVREALPADASVELAAALAFARKRRIGPYAREAADGDRAARQKALAAMARAGFGWSTCERALGMDLEEADERLAADRLGTSWGR
ncbi:MAG: RecX family transcriptional regulator [Labilithrix sp.]|nr:RecX family transcriptional regulator [Labilithrix sp.]